jgi:hypothetical protein
MTLMAKLLALVTILAGLSLSGCETNPAKPTEANNPSPTANSASSQKANQMADKAMYQPIEYSNAAIKGPQLVIIPGEIKSNNATFTQKFGSNNIADFGELELSNANFGVLERRTSALCSTNSSLPIPWEIPTPRASSAKGKFKATKWSLSSIFSRPSRWLRQRL